MAVIQHLEINGLPDYTGLIDLATIKNYLTIDFADNDTLLQSLILSALERLEKACNLSFVQKVITLNVTLEGEVYELPYGPVRSVEAVARINAYGDEVAFTDYRIIGADNTFKCIRSPYYSEHKINYTAGYVTLPESLKQAVYAEVAYRYTHRGDEPQGVSTEALIVAQPFTRLWL